MNQTEDFFSELKEWSTRKLDIIKKYVDGFSRILGSKYKELYYVDGFAGKGIYDGGEKGSPVLIAELAQQYQNSNRPFTLHCINIERDSGNFVNLNTETKIFGSLVTNYEGTFEEHIEKILSQIRNIPAVFFIDPFGVKGTGWDYIEKVIARRDLTDIWIRFDHVTVRRLAGFYESGAKDARGKLKILQDLYGISDGKYLQSRLETGSTSEARICNAVMLYEEQIEKAFSKYLRKGFAASYPIISIDGQRKYHLVFACSKSKAATLANYIINGVEETFQREKEEFQEAQSLQMSLFTSEITKDQIFKEKVKFLKAALLKLPRNNPLRRDELHYQLLVQNKKWFGKTGKPHLTQSIKELINEHPSKFICEGTPGSDDSIITILE
ncbi:MAG: three-Cys-motif partner protein TcmP [Alphaproteobacteria bacterium]|nr:MAG: three-Cys-motif partner protein TcmP [Alphaproteobacteria bacterium]